MADPAPRDSSWNAGGWFGTQLGSTSWMLLSALFLAGSAPALAAVVGALFVLANLFGLGLWRSRQRRSVFTALQIFLAAFWLCSMAAIYAIDRAGHWDTLAWKARNTSATTAYVMLTAIVVMLGFVFRFRQRAAARASGGSA